MVELAGTRLLMADGKGAADLLAKALDTDRRKTLDATEEARANVMRGQLAAGAHDLKGAEAAFEHAVMLDPGSADGAPAVRRLPPAAARMGEGVAPLRGGHPARRLGGGIRGRRARLPRTNRLLEADKAITEAVTRESGNARFLYLQGRVADAIGKAEEA